MPIKLDIHYIFYSVIKMGFPMIAQMILFPILTALDSFLKSSI